MRCAPFLRTLACALARLTRASRASDGGASALAGGLEAVNKALAKAAGVSASSAAGKVTGGAAALRGANRFHIYDIGTVVMAELVIRYTQRARLVRSFGLYRTADLSPRIDA